MQRAEHPTDHQTVPLYLCIVKDFKLHVKSHVLKGGGGRSDKSCQSQKSETVLANAYLWLAAFLLQTLRQTKAKGELFNRR